MKIETKFNIGDIVYMWRGGNEIEKFKITSINIVVDIDKTKSQKGYRLEQIPTTEEIELNGKKMEVVGDLVAFYEYEETLIKKAFKTKKECKENIIKQIKNM